MPVFSQTLFTLVRSHFVLFPFLSTRHSNVLIILNRLDMSRLLPEQPDLYPFLLLFRTAALPSPCRQSSSTRCLTIAVPERGSGLLLPAPPTFLQPAHVDPI